MAKDTSAAPPPARRLDLVERAWDLASSPRLAAGLALALAAAWGASRLLVPPPGPPGAGPALPAWLGPLLDREDPFGSWPFTLLLVMLALSAAAVGLERLPLAAAALRPARRLTPQVERGLRLVRRLPAGPDAGAEADRVAAAFRAGGFQPEAAEADGARYLFAQRGRRARVGEWLAWAGALGLLGLGVAARVAGWDGTMELRQGQATDEVSRRAGGGLLERRRLPFAVRLDGLAVDRREGGAPARESLTLSGPGGREIRRTLGPARALRQDGFDLYQAAWRELPDAVAVLALVDRHGGARRPVRVGPREPFQAGGATFSVEEYSPSFQGQGPAVRVRRAEGGLAADAWLPEGRPDPGARDGSGRWGLEFLGLGSSSLAALRVVYRPLSEALAASAALLLAGLALASSAAHRRLWARVEPGGIVLAGASDRRRAGLERALDEIGRALGGRARP